MLVLRNGPVSSVKARALKCVPNSLGPNVLCLFIFRKYAKGNLSFSEETLTFTFLLTKTSWVCPTEYFLFYYFVLVCVDCTCVYLFVCVYVCRYVCVSM